MHAVLFYNNSRETLPVDVLEEDKPGRLADVLEDEVRGKGEDDVGQIGTRREVARHAETATATTTFVVSRNGKRR